jgi:eukaryotic-like serine/threonine-protein kinase
VELEQSPFLSLISGERIQRTLRMMCRPPNARLTPEITRAICERTGSAAVLEGANRSAARRYVLRLRAQSWRTRDVLYQQQATAATKEDVLDALSHMASGFRARAGESLATVERHSTPLAEATTPSLKALKAYGLGQTALDSAGPPAALPLFKLGTNVPSDSEMYLMFAQAVDSRGQIADGCAEALPLRSSRFSGDIRRGWKTESKRPAGASRKAGALGCLAECAESSATEADNFWPVK